MSSKSGFSRLVIDSDSDSESEASAITLSIGGESFVAKDSKGNDNGDNKGSMHRASNRATAEIHLSMHTRHDSPHTVSSGGPSRMATMSEAKSVSNTSISGSEYAADSYKNSSLPYGPDSHIERQGRETIIALETALASKDMTILKQERIISKLEEGVHERDQCISSLEGELYQLDQLRLRIQEESRNHQRRAAELEADLAHAEKLKKTMNQKLSEQASQIESLEERLYHDRGVPQQYDHLLQEVKELRSQVKTLEAHRDSKHFMNEKLSAQIRDLTGNDERLHDVIAKCMSDIGTRNALIEELRGQCWELEERVEALKDPVRAIQELESKLQTAESELSRVRAEQSDEVVAKDKSLTELQEQLLILQLEVEDQQRVIAAYAADEDVIAVANCLKDLRLREKAFYEFFMAIIMWESNPHIPGADRGIMMDIVDVIRLAERGLLSLRVVHKCHRRRQEGAYLRHPPNVYGKPLWSQAVVSPTSIRKSRGAEELLPEKMKQDSCDGAVRLLDFMDQHQVMEVAKYLCATPLLTEWALSEVRGGKKTTPPGECYCVLEHLFV